LLSSNNNIFYLPRIILPDFASISFPASLAFYLVVIKQHILPSPVHPTGFSFYIFSCFLGIFIWLPSNNSNFCLPRCTITDFPISPQVSLVFLCCCQRTTSFTFPGTLYRIFLLYLLMLPWYFVLLSSNNNIVPYIPLNFPVRYNETKDFTFRGKDLISFKILITLTIFILFLNQTYFRMVPKHQEDCQRGRIPLDLKGYGNLFL